MGCSASKSPGHDDADAHGDALPSVPAAKIPRSSVDPLKESYDALEQLGTGGFSVVRRVRHRATGEAYAMKIIDVKDDEPSATDDAAAASNKEKMSASEIATEIDILRVLKSPTVLRLHEVFHYASHVYVVTEVLSGGAVLEAILRMKDERYTEAEAKVVIQRTLRGIDYMHKNFVLHRDLKLENLLLRSNDDLASVVIADFGLARRCENTTGAGTLPHARGVDTAPVGTPVFAAPEVVEQRSYGAAIDIWSLGVIAYVLLTGAMPRSLWKSALKYGRVTEKDFGFDCFEWDSVSTSGREFVMSCLAFKPTHRLSAASALNHPWLKTVETVRPAPLRIKSKLRDVTKGMKLPLKRYAAGDLLIRQGARATDEVFLIKSGKVDVFVSPTDAEGNVLRDNAVKVATREPGEFIGEMALGATIIAKSMSTKGGLSYNDRVAAVLRKGPPVHARRGKHDAITLKSWVSARIYAKKWIGGRRNADIVAQEDVVCLVMGRNEMTWALASDPEVAAELAKDMRKRRHELDQAKSSRSLGSEDA